MIKKYLSRGDTIVEVLISIAIAAFVMGTSYAIANKSIQKAIAARERNQAINTSQSQLSALKQLYVNKQDISSFNSQYGVPDADCVGPVGPSGCAPNDSHFCLQDAGNGNWARKKNNIDNTVTDISQLGSLSVGNPGFASECLQNGDYVDIFTQVTAASKNSPVNRTVYKVTVGWPQVGSNSNNYSIIYYRF